MQPPAPFPGSEETTPAVFSEVGGFGAPAEPTGRGVRESAGRQHGVGGLLSTGGSPTPQQCREEPSKAQKYILVELRESPWGGGTQVWEGSPHPTGLPEPKLCAAFPRKSLGTE